jgi:putative acetyltransferase
MNINIRKEQTQDIPQVRDILCAAFPTDAESRLVEALRANGKAIISLVAIRDGQVLGHILFSPVSTSPTSPAKGIGLAPVAVHPDVQSQGIGSALIEAGLQLCKDLGYDYCAVLGNPKYYQRFGFAKASPLGMQNEYGVDEEFMLTRFSECDLAPGVIKYAPEFAMFSV